MKLLVIGCGQCGGRIAAEFARLGLRAHVERSIEIVTDAFAVNTDTADLTGLSYIKQGYDHRIVIGLRNTSGHGVGKINELAAEIAKEDGDKVLEAIGKTRLLADTDAFMVIASAAGGTGSGSLPVFTKHLKERFPDKPVYNMVVLPFKHEESSEERSVYNTAVCLKSAYLVSDAIFLVDNQKFVKKGTSLSHNLSAINSMVVEPFYNLLCAGEEKKPEFIGSRTVDAGDIIQTLAGWTVIGHAAKQSAPVRFGFKNTHFRERADESQGSIQVMNSALGDLSAKCNPKDANRAIYLLCAPARKMEMEMVGELGIALKQFAPNAVIRSGDYPRSKQGFEVAVILSELTNVTRVNELFNRAIAYIANRKMRKGKSSEYLQLETSFSDIPSLF
ncbi:MAG: tubulin/FtsZ family protein [Dehalococcoidales bacterium]|nr:tubulin/FtsZ family protein [Dehalococcoidales bacterium]